MSTNVPSLGKHSAARTISAFLSIILLVRILCDYFVGPENIEDVLMVSMSALIIVLGIFKFFSFWPSNTADIAQSRPAPFTANFGASTDVNIDLSISPRQSPAPRC